MDELRRTAYLQAMGVDSYVSRTQLPGAAPTRRLALVPSARAKPAAPPVPRLDDRPGAAGKKTADRERIQARASAVPRDDAIPRFSMAAIVVGGLLWLEDLEGRPLAREQVQLVQAMSRALVVAGSRGEIQSEGAVPVDVSQFDWPMHNNRQLGLGEDAAGASLAGFIGRKLELNCRGLVLLGQGSCARTPLDQIDCATVVKTSSTARMLSSPELKQQVWLDLMPLLAGR